MGLRLFNTSTEKKQEFRPAGETVKMYVCGPTVYDHSHLGHARAYVFFDILRRYLEHQDYRVDHVQNFTDVEDSITKRARAEGVPPLELAERYIRAFLEDMDRLKVWRAHHYPRVSQHIPEMVAVARALMDKGFAYERNGQILFRAKLAKGFGSLTHRDPRTLLVDPAEEDDREDPMDFAIWRRSGEGEPAWPSPWGLGRPGWHIECYAMATKLLGPQLDLHGGGLDLQFPHHESEDSISLAISGLDFSRYWLHNNFITIKGGKMSKSLGNSVTIREALKDYDFEVLRYFLLGRHYREPIDYSLAALKRARGQHSEVARAIMKVRDASEASGAPDPNEEHLRVLARDVRRRFYDAMDDDLNTPPAAGAVLQLARAVNAAEHISPQLGEELVLEFCDFCSVLGLCEEEFDSKQ